MFIMCILCINDVQFVNVKFILSFLLLNLLQLTAECDGKTAQNEKSLHPCDIDADWIERMLSKYCRTSVMCKSLATFVLHLLQNVQDDIDFENQLVEELGRECFDFICILKKHRKMSKHNIQYLSTQDHIYNHYILCCIVFKN